MVIIIIIIIIFIILLFTQQQSQYDLYIFYLYTSHFSSFDHCSLNEQILLHLCNLLFQLLMKPEGIQLNVKTTCKTWRQGLQNCKWYLLTCSVDYVHHDKLGLSFILPKFSALLAIKYKVFMAKNNILIIKLNSIIIIPRNRASIILSPLNFFLTQWGLLIHSEGKETKKCGFSQQIKIYPYQSPISASLLQWRFWSSWPWPIQIQQTSNGVLLLFPTSHTKET